MNAGKPLGALLLALGTALFALSGQLCAQTPLQVEIEGISPPTCAGEHSGSVLARAIGGQEPYRFQLLPDPRMRETGEFRHVPAGVHRIAVYDAVGRSALHEFVMPEPDPIRLDFSLTHPSTCAGTDGAIRIVRIENALQPTVLWFQNRRIGAPVDQTDLAAGFYELVLVDAAGCRAAIQVELRQPVALDASIADLRTPTHCNRSNGWIQVSSPTTGAPPYEFRADDGTWQSESLLDFLPVGTRLVQVRDARGCLWEQAISLNRERPQALLETVRALSSCSDTATADLRLEPLSGQPIEACQLNNMGWYAFGPLLHVPPGKHVIRLRDTAQCESEFSYELTLKRPFHAQTRTITLPLCSRDSSGVLEITVYPEPGFNTGPYQFSADSADWQSDPLLRGLPAGPVVFWTRDSRGCIRSSQAFVMARDPESLNLTVDSDPIPCGETKTELRWRAEGGQQPYEWSLDGSNWSETPPLDSAARGSYTAFVRDARGCVARANDVKVKPFFELQAKTLRYPICRDRRPNGSIELSTNFGTDGVRFSIDGGASYRNQSIFDRLPPAEYLILAYDPQRFCGDSIRLDLSKPIVFYPEIEAKSGNCMGGQGSIQASVKPDSLDIQLEIDRSSRYDSDSWRFGANAHIQNLPPGTYFLKLRDRETQCPLYLNDTAQDAPSAIQIDLESPMQYSLHVRKPSNCFASDGAIWIESPVPGYHIGLNGAAPSDSRFENLPAGQYRLRIENTEGCFEERTVSLRGESMNVAAEPLPSSGAEVSDGSCRVVVSGEFELPLTFTLANDSVTKLDSYHNFDRLSPGLYHGRVKDAVGCAANFSFRINAPQFWISGCVFEDLNGDSLLTANEPGIPGQLVVAQSFDDSAPPVYAFTDTAGRFRLPVRFGSVRVRCEARSMYARVSPVDSGHLVNLDNVFNAPQELNFGLKLKSPTTDMAASVTQRNAAMPGREVEYVVSLWNQGSSRPPANVLLNHDPMLNYLWLNGGQISARQTNRLELAPLSVAPKSHADPLDNCRFRLALPPNPDLMGHELNASVVVDAGNEDLDQRNNLDAEMSVVRNAYDPNIKLVRIGHGNAAPADTAYENQTLDYVIYFQNTGNAPAQTVVVEDALSPLLDLGSFEMVAASHPYQLSATLALPRPGGGTGQTLIWRFDDINLPDSSSSPIESIGFVRFRIRTFRDLGCDRPLENFAAIYFDLNPPIITPTARTLINPTPRGTIFADADTVNADEELRMILINPKHADRLGEWSFDAGAEADTSRGPGPVFVSWRSTGLKTVSLTLSNEFCSQTIETQIYVRRLCPASDLVLTAPDSVYVSVPFAAGPSGTAPAGSRFAWEDLYFIESSAPPTLSRPSRMTVSQSGNHRLRLKVVENDSCEHFLEKDVFALPCPGLARTGPAPAQLCVGEKWTLEARSWGDGLIFEQERLPSAPLHVFIPDEGLIAAAEAAGETKHTLKLKLRDTLTGCVHEVEASLTLDACRVRLPNLFTPNGDGLNDSWGASGEHWQSLSLSVYDRNGQLMFSAASTAEHWDGLTGGAAAPEGTYFYRLEGRTKQGQQVRHAGAFQLLR